MSDKVRLDKVTRVPAKQESEIEKGLCSTCLHQAYCAFPRQLSHPVRECDEFEGLEQQDVIAERITAILLKDTEVLCRVYDGEEDEEADASGTRSKKRGETMDTLTTHVVEKNINKAPNKVMIPHGLCVTCKHVVDCVFPREEGKAILFCEEFEGEVKVETKKVVKPAAPKPVLNDAKGLCRTCESFSTCAFPKAESGVWHCEEYK
jgi:hypothetical protein